MKVVFFYRTTYGYPGSVEIEADDRESAIADFETTYPERKWYSTTTKIDENEKAKEKIKRNHQE